MGMPPLTPFDPSSTALSLSHRFSRPRVFQDVTVAPCSRISTDSPVGKVAVTLSPSATTDGWGPYVEGEMGTGLCRSTISAIVF